VAINTRNRRFSLVGMARPWMAVLPNPDGPVDQPDRQHFEYCYPGITFSAGIELGAAGIGATWVLSASRTTWKLPVGRTMWKV
jgi:hypothetical protein